jgi:hypothetical protein
MSIPFKTNQIKELDSDQLTGGTDDACHLLRLELDALRSNRTALKDSRRKEIKLLDQQHRNAKEKLQRKLPEHINLKIYRQFLQYYERDMSEYKENNIKTQPGGISNSRRRSSSCAVPVSNYIIQQETPLLSAMHRSFCVFPNQKDSFKAEYEREIYPYFKKEIEALHLDTMEVSDMWMSRLSKQLEENDVYYKSYRTKLEKIEMEVKRYRGLLSQQRAAKKLGKDSGNDDDENSSLSETEHSSDSDDGLSSQDEGGVDFFGNISDAFQEHINKGGEIFQIAANNFLLPFKSKDDCIET